MSSVSPDNDDFGDQLICDVYVSDDLKVTAGINAGDGVTNASDSSLGDVYIFSAKAHAHDLVVREDASAPKNDSDEFEDNTEGQSVGSGSEIGTLGQGLELESRLTMMGSDGSTVEVLIINNTDINPEGGPEYYSGEYFLPLSPLTPEIDYTLIQADEDPGEFSYADYTCVCFTRGTAITMADGSETLIEALREGDLVRTKDNGAQALRWVGSSPVRAYGHLAPIVISKGALGNQAELIVSPQHRMLLADWRAEVMLGSHEVLVKAKDLIDGDKIYRREGGRVEYYHLLFDNHEIIFAEGIPSESLQINGATLDAMAADSRAEIIELFPDITTDPQISAVASRMSLKSYEAAALLKQVNFH